MANTVCATLNHYWPDAKVINCILPNVYATLHRGKAHSQQEYNGQHKIGSLEEYRGMAKDFSHRLRAQIKDSYLTFNGTLKVWSSS